MINKFDEITRNTMLELEKTQRDFWNISRATAEFLYLSIIEHKAKNVLEVGTSNGYSGLWMLDALKVTRGHLTTIEYYDKRQSIARNNFDKCGFAGMYTPILGSACDIIEGFDSDKKFDFVLIDANKREYVKNFELLKPHLLPNAILCADNVNSHREKVQTYLDAVGADEEFQTEILDLPAGLAVSYKL